jgi:hypothetical protein
MRRAVQPTPLLRTLPRHPVTLASRRRERIRGIRPISAEQVKDVPICPARGRRAGALEPEMAFFVRETAGQIGVSYVS